MPDDPRYAIGDLADLGGVSRRTVRYYVQEGLLPTPHGLGRGNHYGPEHLDRLLTIKALQEGGRTLEEIRRALRATTAGKPDAGNADAGLKSRATSRATTDAGKDAGLKSRATLRATAGDRWLERSVWRRITLAPGVELNVAGDVRLPPPGKLAELAVWCRMHFPAQSREEDDDA